MISEVQSGVISECIAKNNPWASPVVQNKAKQNKKKLEQNGLQNIIFTFEVFTLSYIDLSRTI